MKFLIDAQLPPRLARWFTARGHSALHTLDLPRQNQTPDNLLLQLADAEQRILVTKDTDFLLTFELGLGPAKLLLVTTGNVHNDILLDLFSRHEALLLALLEKHNFIELSSAHVLVHV